MLDMGNTVMWDDYKFEGVLEMARVSSLSIQTAARVSPGTGISSNADHHCLATGHPRPSQ